MLGQPKKMLMKKPMMLLMIGHVVVVAVVVAAAAAAAAAAAEVLLRLKNFATASPVSFWNISGYFPDAAAFDLKRVY